MSCAAHSVDDGHSHIIISAQLPHLFSTKCPRTDVVARGPAPKREGEGGGVLPPSTVTPVASGASTKRDSRGWRSSSDDEDHHSSRRVPTPWVSSSSQPPPSPDVRVPTTPPVCLPPGFQSPPATAHLLAFAQSIAPCDSALMKPATAKMIETGATHGVPISHARQASTPLSFLTFSLIVNRFPCSWTSRAVGLLALFSIQISAADVRPTSSRSFPGILDLHEVLIRACRLRTSMARGM